MKAMELLRRVFRILGAMLREVFDEAAYGRFLAQTGSHRSSASYREFMRERETATARKPRCC
jgi:hypothetical protein